jgi:hypothetical protein
METIGMKSQQRKGLKRNTVDKFYTKSFVVNLCMEYIRENIIFSENDIIIEPSAGNGSFIEQIKKTCKNYEFYDIEPEFTEIIKKDFLEYKYTKSKEKYEKIHIIGNPPFGRQASIAIKFIRKCCEFSDSISFILPKSFRKESMKRHFTLNFHLIYEIDLPDKSFVVNDEEYDVPCILQIWIKKDKNREVPQKQLPFNFDFVKKEENPDISFRRVGVNAGHITKEIINKSQESHYFIKFKNDIDDIIFDKLSSIKFDFNNTVGPKSISKQEMIEKFNLILQS